MLDSNYYTVSNALNYQMFLGHCKAVNSSGKLGQKIVHVILAALEITPVIGQIIALFELAVVKTFGLANGQTFCDRNVDPQENKNQKNSVDQSAQTTKIWPRNLTRNQCLLGFGLAVITAIGVTLAYRHFNVPVPVPPVPIEEIQEAIYPSVSDRIEACLDSGLFKVYYNSKNDADPYKCSQFLKDQLCGPLHVTGFLRAYAPLAKFDFLNQCVGFIEKEKYSILENKFEFAKSCITLVENTCKA